MALTLQTQFQVTRLYVALFGRAPDAEGLNYWGALKQSGVSLPELTNAMFSTAPARQYFPENSTTGEIVASFYLNVLGRPADAEGLAHWIGRLQVVGDAGAVLDEMIRVVVDYRGADPAGLESAALFNSKVALATRYTDRVGKVEFGHVLGNMTHSGDYSAYYQFIEALAADPEALTLGGLGSIDLSGWQLMSVSAMDSDGGNLAIAGLPAAVAGFIRVGGWFDKLSIFVDGFSPGGLDFMTLGMTAMAVVVDAAAGRSARGVGDLHLEHVDSLSLTSQAEFRVGQLRTPDLEHLRLDTVLGASVVVADAPLLNMVDAGSVRGNFSLLAPSNVGLTVVATPGNDSISIGGGRIDLRGGRDLVTFQNVEEDGSLELVLNSAASGLAGLASSNGTWVWFHHPDNGASIEFEVNERVLSQLTFRGTNLASASSDLDLFIGGLEGTKFSSGTNVAARWSGSSRAELVFDTDGDGFMTGYDTTVSVALGLVPNELGGSFVFDASFRAFVFDVI